MRILIYLPPGNRAVDQQSVMEMLAKNDHEVYLLTHAPEGDLHRNVQQYGVKTFSCNIPVGGLRNYYKHVRFLSNFIRKHKIAVVFAHLQAAGFIAGLTRLTTRFKFYYVRHNTDEHFLGKNRNAAIINWLSAKLASTIIAPSEKVYKYLTQSEKITPSKIIRVNYGYNFSQYLQTDRLGKAADIRDTYACKMLVVSVARLIPVKRHLLMFDVIKRMVNNGLDVKFICLSDGVYRPVLEEYISSNNLDQHFFLLGNQRNVFDYLEASDVFFHLSETEASNSSLKEAGFCKIPAIACNDVGDFDDYIENGVNGFLVDKADPVEPSLQALTTLYNDPALRKNLGENLYNTVVKEFSIEKVVPLYNKLLNSTNNKA
ncbi:MAG TPA: glycosyltransferase family 4 protein [Chitinophagaceae bacterium]